MLFKEGPRAELLLLATSNPNKTSSAVLKILILSDWYQRGTQYQPILRKLHVLLTNMEERGLSLWFKNIRSIQTNSAVIFWTACRFSNLLWLTVFRSTEHKVWSFTRINCAVDILYMKHFLFVHFIVKVLSILHTIPWLFYSNCAYHARQLDFNCTVQCHATF